MFRRNFPALTLLVFSVGLGLGFSWSRGLIPLTISPAKSGTLSIEVAHREPLPPPNDPLATPNGRNKAGSLDAPPSDPGVFEQQSEPTTDVKSIRASNAAYEHDGLVGIRSPRHTEINLADDEADPVAQNENRRATSPPVRIRNKTAIQLDPDAGIEEAPPVPRGRQVVATRHQDPSEPTDDSRQSHRDSKVPSLSPRDQIAAAEEKLAAGETLAAHRDLSKIYWNHKELRPQLQETIDSTAKAIFFKPKPHYIEPYVIQEGERLEAIAKKYQMTWEYLAKLNQTEPRRIQIGQKLKVVKGPFAAVVDLQDFTLTVHLQGYYVKRYQVGIGQDGSSPLGKFSVLNKVENPQYTDPNGRVVAANDPTNPLGERWLDLGNSYGIHGTIDPNSIGKAKSRGCIRLLDKEIIEVYDFLVKGSEVVIRK